MAQKVQIPVPACCLLSGPLPIQVTDLKYLDSPYLTNYSRHYRISEAEHLQISPLKKYRPSTVLFKEKGIRLNLRQDYLINLIAADKLRRPLQSQSPVLQVRYYPLSRNKGKSRISMYSLTWILFEILKFVVL